MDIAQLKNLLILFLVAYKEEYGGYVLDISFLYAMLTGKEYHPREEEKKAEFEAFMIRVIKCEKIKKWLWELQKHKEKLENNYLLQTTIKQVVSAYHSYFRASADYQKNPGKYKAKPQAPKTKKLREIKTGSAEFNILCLDLDGKRLILRLRMQSQAMNIALSQECSEREIKSARLIRIGSDYYLHVVYSARPVQEKASGEFLAGIDTGMDNLLTVVSSNPEIKSFIISGKELKAFNQWYNKEKSKLQTQMDILKKESKTQNMDNFDQIAVLQRRIAGLCALRKRRLDNDLHKISRKLVEILHDTGHQKIYLGTGGTDSKQNISLGKVTNQNFVSLPFRKLMKLIEYKALTSGLQIIETPEPYTSKSSSLSDDIVAIQKHAKNNEKRTKLSFSGRRVHRGLFHDDKLDKVFHADTNGALNILKAGAKLHQLSLSSNILLFKLANPIKFRLMTFFYKVSCKSLLAGIAGSST